MSQPNSDKVFFKPSERCAGCNDLIMSEHVIFMFTTHPSEHLAEHLHQGPGEWRPWEGGEWRPCPELKPIPFDNGPPRVAYQWLGEDDRFGEAVVMVYGDEIDDLWLPCHAVKLACHDCWFWVCKPFGPKDPCDNEWLRSISS